MEPAGVEPWPNESPEQDYAELQCSLKHYKDGPKLFFVTHAKLEEMHKPPAGVSNWHVMCACQRRQHRVVSFRRMERAAARQCRLCTLSVQITRTVVDGHISECPTCAATAIELTERLDALVVSGSENHLSIWTLCGRIALFAFVDDEVSADFKVQGFQFRAGLVFDPDTSSDRTLRHAQRWLDRCVRDHSCSEATTQQFPRRLLDLRRDPIRLIETTGDEQPYVCLSHRWGDEVHRRLISTVTTIQSHMDGIPSDKIPKTFLDAIAVCRRLNMDYLWIDTLCILQSCNGLTESQVVETKADFARENSAMASIYRNSYLTISADISTHMDSGLFSAKSKPECTPIEVEDDTGHTRTVYAREVYVQHAKQPTDLETRGWTFQESLLPPRLLCFGQFDIRWRCREDHFCECGDITGERSSWRDSLQKAAQLPKNSNETRKWWDTVVPHYVTRGLTHAHDKLPALSALARVYQEVDPDTYMAGLWKKSILHDLCWYSHAEPNRFMLSVGGKRSMVYRAPSWSWASIDTLDGTTCNVWGEQHWDLRPPQPMGDQRAVCVYLDSTCRPKTGDPTGEVDSECHIELGVSLVSAVVARSQEDSSGCMWPWTITQVEDGSVVRHCMPDCYLDDDQLDYGCKIYCAPILEVLSDQYSDRGSLMLKHLHGETYQRVGFCILEADNAKYWKDKDTAQGVWESYVKDGKLLDYAFKFDADNCDRITLI